MSECKIYVIISLILIIVCGCSKAEEWSSYNVPLSETAVTSFIDAEEIPEGVTIEHTTCTYGVDRLRDIKDNAKDVSSCNFASYLGKAKLYGRFDGMYYAGLASDDYLFVISGKTVNDVYVLMDKYIKYVEENFNS